MATPGKSYISSPSPFLAFLPLRAFIPDSLSLSSLRLRLRLRLKSGSLVKLPVVIHRVSYRHNGGSGKYAVPRAICPTTTGTPPTFSVPSHPIMNGSQLGIEGCWGCRNRAIRAPE